MNVDWRKLPGFRPLTVADLVAKLLACPQDARVFIHDADTDWRLPLLEQDAVKIVEDVVLLRSDYSNMDVDQ